jgi:archaellum biogenesis ATPase FlaH
MEVKSMYVKEMIKLMEALGYQVKDEKRIGVVDKLLGRFQWEEEKTSTEVLKGLRETGYGKY